MIFYHRAIVLLRRLSVLFFIEAPAAAGHSMAVQRGCPAFLLGPARTGVQVSG
jgi:hypothetical protein